MTAGYIDFVPQGSISYCNSVLVPKEDLDNLARIPKSNPGRIIL